MDLEDELGPGEVEEEEEEYWREPDQRMQGQMGRGLRLEPYEGSLCWLEYRVYFEQMVEFQGCSPQVAAMALGLSLRGAARTVLVSLAPKQRRNLRRLMGALRQSFCPPEQVRLYQEEQEEKAG